MVVTNLILAQDLGRAHSLDGAPALLRFQSGSKGASLIEIATTADTLSEFRAQQVEILGHIREYQVLVASAASLDKLVSATSRIVARVRANLESQEAWLARENDLCVRSNCLANRSILEEVSAFQANLIRGQLKSTAERAHGLDGIVAHYLIDDLFGINGLITLGKLASSEKRSLL